MKRLSLILTLVLFGAVFAIAQKTVTGTITDDKGSGLVGASVAVKGTTVGTVTDLDGKFSLSVPDGTTTLVVSSIGLETKEIKLGASSDVSLKMYADTKALSEVVVTGTGVGTNKKKLGIAVESISTAQLPEGISSSVDQALVGKIPGAQISSVNGNPGQQVSIILRGINTLNRGTTPMILLDGLQLGASDFNSIDLNAIDRIEVVEGAASASLYGAQGANGVIQLFSKKGKAGDLRINFSSSISTSTSLNIGGVAKANLNGFVVDGNNNVVDSKGNPLAYDPAGILTSNLVFNSLDPTNQTIHPYTGNLKYYDHFAEFFVPASGYNNAISISGGSGKFDFNFSGSNNRQYSVFKNNGFNDRSNFLANIGIELAPGLKFRTTTQLVYTRNTLVDPSGANVIYGIDNTRPFANYEFKDAAGFYVYNVGAAGGVNGVNPNYRTQNIQAPDDKVDVIQGFNLNYKPWRFLDLDAKYGINYRREEASLIYANQSAIVSSTETGNFSSNYGSDATGEIDRYSYNTLFQNFNATATVRTDFQKDFGLKIPITTATQVGFDYRYKKFNQFNTASIGLPSYTPFTGSQANSYLVASDYTEPFVTYGYLFNQRFDFGDFAGIAGGFRSDYSSAFGEGSTPFTFPNANGYLRFSQLNFWNNLVEAIPEFKIRAAYGKAGIQPTPFQRYVTLSTKTVGNSNVFFVGSNSANPDLGVEVSGEKEIGADLTLNLLKGNWLKNIRFSATYWNRTTDNAIWPLDVAPSSGVGTLTYNSMSLASHGIQASANAFIFHTNDFSWNFTANFASQNSIISHINGGQPIVLTSAVGSTGYVLAEGEKIGQLYGYLLLHSVTEADPATGQPYIKSTDQANYVVASNGWVVNKTTKQCYVTPSTHSFGDPNPLFNMAFINEFSYKNFLTFSFQLDWVNGSHVYNQTKEWMYRDGIHSDYQQPITIDGQTGAWSAFYRSVYANVSRDGTKNYFYEDASFVRLRNVSLAFDFGKFINIKGISKLQLVLTGRNLWTATKYTGFDPEISSSVNINGNANQGGLNSAWDRGTDHNTQPNIKTYQVGINVGF